MKTTSTFTNSETTNAPALANRASLSARRGRHLLTMLGKLLLTASLAFGLHGTPVAAQTVNFGGAQITDNTGSYSPKVVLDKYGRALVVTGSDAGVLAYEMGNTLGTWGLYGEPNNINAGTYDNGYTPAIALNSNGTLIETHSAGWLYNSTLWYHVGSFSNGNVNFGPSIYFDFNGAEPTVAVNDSNTVVEIHRQYTSNGWQSDFGWNHSTNLWYHIGTVNTTNNSIHWSNSNFLDTGNTPSVAINGNTVVEVHRSASGPNLFYRVGTLNGDAINWGSSTLYDIGYTPSICITGNTVFETHFDGGGGGKLYSRVGRINGNSISWSAPRYYDYGYSSASGLSIATNGNKVMEVHLGDWGTAYWSEATIQW